MRDSALPFALTFFLIGASAGLVASRELAEVSWLQRGEDASPHDEAIPGEAGGRDVEAARAHSEAERYRRGLERAVAELNRLARECRRPRAEAAPVPPQPSPPEVPRDAAKPAHLVLEGPRLQLWEEDLVAYGSVRNTGGTEGGTDVLLQLVRDGEVIDEERVQLWVPAGGRTDYEHRFWAGELEGSYQVRGRLVDSRELY